MPAQERVRSSRVTMIGVTPWTATRIATALHQSVLAPLGFDRHGSTCRRVDGHLTRTVAFYGLPAARPSLQLWVAVALRGLPDAVAPQRRDTLWGAPRLPGGDNTYPRPPRVDPLPEDLVADLSGPAVEFLLHATDLSTFMRWAEEIYRGDGQPGYWRRFQPVLPRGTGPLQAAAFAAALLGDRDTVTRLAGQVAAEEPSVDERIRFRAELAHLAPR